MGGGVLLAAQSVQNGSLAGKLTDLHSKPLEGALVVLRNDRTGAEIREITQKNGAYRFGNVTPGEYSLNAESPTLGRGQLQGIVVASGHESRVQAAIELDRQAPQPPVVTTLTTVDTTPRLLPSPSGTGAGLHAMTLTANIRASLPASTAVPDLSAAAGTAKLSAGLLPSPTAWAPGMALAVAGALAAFQVKESIPQQVLAASRMDGSPSVATAEVTTGEQLQELPITARNWAEFGLDAPAARGTNDDEGREGQGHSQPQADVRVDGSSTGLAFGRGAGRRAHSPSLTSSGIAETVVSEVRTGDRLEDGTGTADPERTHVDTRRGGPHLHGQAFLYDRQNLWGAQNPFTQWVKETAPATLTAPPVFTAFPYTPPNRDMTWGFGAGSLIHGAHLSWFSALDGSETNDPAVATVKHPENFFAQPASNEMQVLSARLGMSSLNPVAEGLSAYSGTLEQLSGMLGPTPRTAKQWSGFGRLDWDPAERHRFTLEGSGARSDSPGGGLSRTSETFGTHSFGTSRASKTFLLGRWEAFLTPNLLATTQGSMGRQILAEGPETPSTYEQSLNINQWGQLPQIAVDSRYGFTMGNPARFAGGSYPDEHLYEAQEGLAWVRKGLLLKAGASVRHAADATTLLRNHTGTYSYSTIEDFVSDALVFAKFGMTNALNPYDQHNCDQRGRAWMDGSGQLHGLGYLPCYSYYSQMMGPTDWHMSTNDWAGYAAAQWEAGRQLVLSAAMRWELEQLPPPIALVNNPDLPMTGRLPSLGSEWAPRASLAWGSGEAHWPVLRLGYGMYFGRTMNSVVETALTETGSPRGDLYLFMRPTDNLTAGGAPPFPYVLAGEPSTVVKPAAVEFAPSFKNGEIHQGVLSVEEKLPGRVEVAASAVVSLGRRLPVTVDTNFDPGINPGTITYRVVDASGIGPLKRGSLTIPFFASWPSVGAVSSGGRLNANYQQISALESRANSTYEAAILRISRTSSRGFAFNGRYTYSHAMDWNPNESAHLSGSSMLDPTDMRAEYGTSDLDMRHSASVSLVWHAPWKIKDWAGQIANGWMLSGIGQFHSGLPYTMRTSGSITREFDSAGAVISGLGAGMNGSGGDDRVYGVGRNTYRYPLTWKLDLRVAKKWNLGEARELELLAESFNLFNHQNVTQLETTGYYITSGGTNGSLPTLNFLTGLKAGQTEFGQPLNVNATDFYRPRQIDFGMRMRF